MGITDVRLPRRYQLSWELPPPPHTQPAVQAPPRPPPSGGRMDPEQARHGGGAEERGLMVIWWFGSGWRRSRSRWWVAAAGGFRRLANRPPTYAPRPPRAGPPWAARPSPSQPSSGSSTPQPCRPSSCGAQPPALASCPSCPRQAGAPALRLQHPRGADPVVPRHRQGISVQNPGAYSRGPSSKRPGSSLVLGPLQRRSRMGRTAVLPNPVDHDGTKLRHTPSTEVLYPAVKSALRRGNASATAGRPDERVRGPGVQLGHRQAFDPLAKVKERRPIAPAGRAPRSTRPTGPSLPARQGAPGSAVRGYAGAALGQLGRLSGAWNQ